MNLPNKLTLLRIILIPFFVFFLLAPVDIPGKQYIALGIFAIASLTDLIDGKIARKYNLVTNFGKFMDPIADKLLVSTALICFVQLDWIPAYMAVIIIAREFIVTGMRLLANGEGRVIAASMWGKAKTVTQIIAISLLLLDNYVIPVKPTKQFFKSIAAGLPSSFVSLGNGFLAFYVSDPDSIDLTYNDFEFSSTVYIFRVSRLGRFKSVDLSDRCLNDTIKKFKGV